MMTESSILASINQGPGTFMPENSGAGMMENGSGIDAPQTATQMEQEFREKLDIQQLRLCAVLDAVPANIAVLDSSGKVLSVNEGWRCFARENDANAAVVYGIDINYLDVCRQAEAKGDTTAGAAANGIDSVLRGRQRHFSMEYACEAANQTRWFAMSATALGPSSSQGAVILHFDITSRRQMELEVSRQRELLARESRLHSLSELASGITHELTQPLTAMGYYCDALQTVLEKPSDKPDTALSLMKRLRDQAVRAMDVVSQLRTFMRRLYPDLAVLSVSSLLTEASSLMESFAYDRKCRLFFCVTDDLPPIIGDATQLKQVLMHLLHNAIEASAAVPGQIPWVRVTADHESDWVRVSVQDNGPGMDGALAEDIFKMMKTEAGDRLGLGLNISLSIIKAHGGRLWLDSSGTRGSCFHFTLPIAGGES